jgi:hypothetical protein
VRDRQRGEGLGRERRPLGAAVKCVIISRGSWVLVRWGDERAHVRWLRGAATPRRGRRSGGEPAPPAARRRTPPRGARRAPPPPPERAPATCPAPRAVFAARAVSPQRRVPGLGCGLRAQASGAGSMRRRRARRGAGARLHGQPQAERRCALGSRGGRARPGPLRLLRPTRGCRRARAHGGRCGAHPAPQRPRRGCAAPRARSGRAESIQPRPERSFPARRARLRDTWRVQLVRGEGRGVSD